MRSIGLCELLIELMMVRASERAAFGRPVIQYDTVQRWIAESRIELEQARLLCYRCAWRLDQAGHHDAWRDVSLIKVAVPAILQRIADRALQVHGSFGISDDAPFVHMLLNGYHLGLADGPTEVHKATLARELLKGVQPSEGVFPAYSRSNRAAAARARYAEVLKQYGKS